MGVAVARAIALITENLLFMQAFTAKLLNCPSLTFRQPILIAAVSSLSVFFLSKWCEHFIEISSWGSLIVVSLSISLVFLFGAYFLAFSKAEKASVRSLATDMKTKFGL